MKLCKDCKYFLHEEDKGHTCIYHQSKRVYTDLVYGDTTDIVDIPSNKPSKMRDGTEFTFRWWKNCGRSGKFWDIERNGCISYLIGLNDIK